MAKSLNCAVAANESQRRTKQKGLCPFCLEEVSPEVVEENRLRRDKCLCPKCKEHIYLCRTPGCHNYAKGTEVYDHELCPACTKAAAEFCDKYGELALKLLLFALAKGKSRLK